MTTGRGWGGARCISAGWTAFSSSFFCLSEWAWPGDTLSCQDRLRLLSAGSRGQGWHPGISVPCLVHHPAAGSLQQLWHTAHTHTHTTLSHTHYFTFTFYAISWAARLNPLTYRLCSAWIHSPPLCHSFFHLYLPLVCFPLSLSINCQV